MAGKGHRWSGPVGRLVSCGVLAVAVAVARPAAGQQRTWTDIDGRTLEAEIAGVEGRTVVVVLPNGSRRELLAGRLSRDDLDWVDDWQAGRSAAGSLPPVGWPMSAGAGAVRIETLDPVGGDSYFASEHFEFQCDGEVSASLVQEFAQAAESTLAAVAALPVRGLVDRPRDGGRYFVRALADEKAFQQAGGPPGAAGAYLPGGRGGSSVLLVPFSSLGADTFRARVSKGFAYDNRVLVHELTHQVMGGNTFAVPAWLREGLAEYMSVTTYSNGSFRLAPSERETAVRGRLRHYGHIDIESATFFPSDQMSAPWEWVMDLGFFFGEQGFGYEPARDGLVAQHRFYMTSMLLVTYFLHYDGAGEARRIRLYANDLLAGMRHVRSRGRDGYLPAGLMGRADVGRRDVILETERILLDGRKPDEVHEAMVEAFAARGIRLGRPTF